MIGKRWGSRSTPPSCSPLTLCASVDPLGSLNSAFAEAKCIPRPRRGRVAADHRALPAAEAAAASDEGNCGFVLGGAGGMERRRPSPRSRSRRPIRCRGMAFPVQSSPDHLRGTSESYKVRVRSPTWATISLPACLPASWVLCCCMHHTTHSGTTIPPALGSTYD